MDDFLIYAGYILNFVILAVFLFSFSSGRKANVFFISYLVFVLVVQYSMELLYQLKMENLVLNNIYFIGQSIIMALFYHSILKSEAQKKFIKYSLALGLIILLVQFYFDPSQFKKFNLLEITITCLLVVIYGLFHFYYMLTNEKQYYYFTVGIVSYLLTSTVLFLVGNLTVGLSVELRLISWKLNAVLVIVYYLFILYEWKVNFKPKKELKKT